MFGFGFRRLFILGIVAVALFAALQYGPAYLAALQFNDFIRQEVRFAAASRKTPEIIRAEIVSRASELNIPLTARDVRITRRGPSFTVELDYSWPIDLRVYQHDLQFHASESGEVFEDVAR